MIPLKTQIRMLSMLVALAILIAPISAQQKTINQPPQQKPAQQQPSPPTPPKPAPAKSTAKNVQTDTAVPTIETLLAADSYKIYGEIRNVGQLVRSGNITDVLDPMMKVSGTPKEIKALVEFVNARAESLATARMVLATWPAKAKLPQFVVAIEFNSAEEARKFEPQLREVMPKIMPTPTPEPTPSPGTEAELLSLTADIKPVSTPNKSEPAAVPVAKAAPTIEPKSEAGKASPAGEDKPAPPPFVIKQVGTLVLLSNTIINLKSLRPAGSTLLAENESFRHAHDRFPTEPIFIFFNVALEDKVQAALEAQYAEERKKIGIEESVKPDETMPDSAVVEDTKDPTETEQPDPATVVVTDMSGVPQGQATATLSVQTAPKGQAIDLGLNQLMGAIFGGQPKWPEAVGAAISFDGDGYVARVLLVNGADGKASPVPIIPQLVSGPALAPESPTILPADTEMFITASIDGPQIYAGLAKTMSENFAREQTYRRANKDAKPDVPFGALEKQLGLTIKDDLLPVLGNEIAISFPVSSVMGTPKAPRGAKDSLQLGPDGQNAEKKPEPSPVLLISLKDKQAAHLLLPRIIDGLGFKGAGMLAQTERRDDTEIVSYANAFAYAFIGNFLVLSPDVVATRHVVDNYLSHQTLSSDSHFRNSVRWQPRQVTGQVYLSPALMENFRASINAPESPVSDRIRETLQRLGPEAEPVTYALSNEGPGPLHEMHLPKNLLLMLVASIVGAGEQSPLRSNEGMARMALAMIVSSENSYREDKGKGGYGTLDQLIADGVVEKNFLQDHGYRIELIVTGTKFEATATPIEYGTTGRLSFFVDETGVIRAADHGGGPATVADEPGE